VRLEWHDWLHGLWIIHWGIEKLSILWLLTWVGLNPACAYFFCTHSLQRMESILDSYRIPIPSIPIGIQQTEIPRKFCQSYKIPIRLSWTVLRQKLLRTCHFMSIWLAIFQSELGWIPRSPIRKLRLQSESNRNRWGSVKTSQIAKPIRSIASALPLFMNTVN